MPSKPSWLIVSAIFSPLLYGSQCFSHGCGRSDILVVVEHCTLKFITSVQKKGVFCARSNIINDRLDASVATIAASARIVAVRPRRSKLIEMGVDIVYVKEGYVVQLGILLALLQ
jgi:hypothetical protein